MNSSSSYAELLAARIELTGSRLCVGLDPRPELHGDVDGVRQFLRQVVEETYRFAACYKPNSAYFESMGGAGFDLLAEVATWSRSAEVPVILDCKRGDIGTTQKQYAKMAYDFIGADAVTLSPYMGRDSIEPFLETPGKGVYLLGLTSNPGAADLQLQSTADGGSVFEIVCQMAESTENAGLVLGLTQADPEVFSRIPDVPLLMPGLGAQGGDLAALAGQDRKAPVVINVSRGILYKEPHRSFQDKAEQFAEQIASVLPAES